MKPFRPSAVDVSLDPSLTTLAEKPLARLHSEFSHQAIPFLPKSMVRADRQPICQSCSEGLRTHLFQRLNEKHPLLFFFQLCQTKLWQNRPYTSESFLESHFRHYCKQPFLHATNKKRLSILCTRKPIKMYFTLSQKLVTSPDSIITLRTLASLLPGAWVEGRGDSSFFTFLPFGFYTASYGFTSYAPLG